MKTFLKLIPTLLLIASCRGNVPVDTSKLKIVTPVGAPAYAFYNYAKVERFETNALPKNIVAMMSESSDKDIVVIDTTSGIQAINNGAPYKLAATVTFGNFYIASTGNDNDGILNKGDSIVLFNKGGIPDVLFHYLYGNDFDEQIEYVAAVNNAAACLSGTNVATGNKVDYVFLAEPVLTVQLKTYSNAKIYADIQDEFKKKTDGKEMIQASLFIKNSVDTKIANQFLKDLETSINEAIEDSSKIGTALDGMSDEEIKNKMGAPAAIAMAVTKKNNGLGLGYKNAYENKTNIDNFVKLFNINETSEEIYFK